MSAQFDKDPPPLADIFIIYCIYIGRNVRGELAKAQVNLLQTN